MDTFIKHLLGFDPDAPDKTVRKDWEKRDKKHL
jgi:hypothetical protein